MSTSPRLESVKHSWGHDETGCSILHVDMDAFFASCEVARHPHLAHHPVIIGTGSRSVVSTANYEARQFGIHSAQSLASAHRLCPQGVFLPVDHQYYSMVSRRIFDQLRTLTDHLQQVSIDEAYVDVSGIVYQWKSPVAIARWIRQRVWDVAHVTCSVGIASNMLIAKLASTNAKPNGMLLIPASRNEEFIHMFPVQSVPGIGPATAKVLHQYGISTVQQLSELSVTQIQDICHSSSLAYYLSEASHGISRRKVVPRKPEKSIGEERTFTQDTTSLAEVKTLVQHCADDICLKLRSKQLVARTITVKVRFADFSYRTKSFTCPSPFTSSRYLMTYAFPLLCSLITTDPSAMECDRPLRLAGLSVSKLSAQAQTAIQPELSLETSQAPDHRFLEKSSKAEHVLDVIKTKYGDNSISFGLSPQIKLEHGEVMLKHEDHQE